MSASKSKNRSTRKNHVVIDIEHAEELQEARRELRALYQVTNIVAKKIVALKERIEELEKILKSSKNGGGKKGVSFRNKNGSPLHNVRNYNANGELLHKTRNHTTRKRHSPPSPKAMKKWENSLKVKDYGDGDWNSNSEHENLGNLFRRQMKMRNR